MSDNGMNGRKATPCNAIGCTAVMGIVAGQITEGLGYCAEEPPTDYEERRPLEKL